MKIWQVRVNGTMWALDAANIRTAVFRAVQAWQEDPAASEGERAARRKARTITVQAQAWFSR